MGLTPHVLCAGSEKLSAGEVRGQCIRGGPVGEEGGEAAELLKDRALVTGSEGVEKVLYPHA